MATEQEPVKMWNSEQQAAAARAEASINATVNVTTANDDIVSSSGEIVAGGPSTSSLATSTSQLNFRAVDPANASQIDIPDPSVNDSTPNNYQNPQSSGSQAPSGQPSPAPAPASTPNETPTSSAEAPSTATRIETTNKQVTMQRMPSMADLNVEIPTNPRARVIWFLRQVRDSYLNEPGAFISENVFLSSGVWHMMFVEPRVTKLLKERTKMLAKLIKMRTANSDDKSLKKLDREVLQVFRVPITLPMDAETAAERNEMLFTPRRQGTFSWLKSSSSSSGRGQATSAMSGVIATSSTNTVISGGADTPVDANNANSSAALFLDAASQMSRANGSDAGSISASEDAASFMSKPSSLKAAPTTSMQSSFGRMSLRSGSSVNKEAEAVLAGYAGVIGELAHAALQEGYGGVSEKFMSFVAEVVCPKVVQDVFDLLQIYIDHELIMKLMNY